jgi:hypothetical protein
MPIRCITAALVQEIIRSYGQVRKLNLSSNAIERVEELEALTSLTKLNLADNQLTSNPRCLEGLLRLTALEELDLSCNEIRQLDVFSHHVIQQQQQQQPAACLSLHSLNLEDNRISDMAQIVHLQQLSCLTKLQLSGNPLCNVMHYKAKVKALLPRLLVLDDEPLSDDRGYSSSNSDDSSSNSSDHSSSSTCNSRDNCSDIAEDVADASNYLADSVNHQASVGDAGELDESVIADTAVSTAMPATAIAAHTLSTSAAAVVDEICTDDILAGLAILSPVDAKSADIESTSVIAAMPTVAAAETVAAVADAAVTEQADIIDVSDASTLQQQQEQQQPHLQQQQHVSDRVDVDGHAVVLSDTNQSRTDTAIILDDDSETSNVHINDSTNASAAASSHTVAAAAAAAAADNSVNVAAFDSSADTVAITDDDNSNQLNSQTASSDTVVQTAIPLAVDSIHESVPSTAECTAAAAAASDTASPIPLVTTTAAHKVDAIAEQLQYGMDAPPAVLQTATGSIDDTSNVVTSNHGCSSIDTTQLQHNASDRTTIQQHQQRSQDVGAQQAVSGLYKAAAATVLPAVQNDASTGNTSNVIMGRNTVEQPTSTTTGRSTVPLAAVTAPNTSSNDADVIASLKREVALLTVQNAAMKRAALMADTAGTASSARVNATQQQQQQQQQHTVSRIRRRPWEVITDGNSSNTSDTLDGSTIDSGGSQQQQHDDTTDVDKYVKLLNHWRHEVVKLLIQQASQQVR